MARTMTVEEMTYRKILGPSEDEIWDIKGRANERLERAYETIGQPCNRTITAGDVMAVLAAVLDAVCEEGEP